MILQKLAFFWFDLLLDLQLVIGLGDALLWVFLHIFFNKLVVDVYDDRDLPSRVQFLNEVN